MSLQMYGSSEHSIWDINADVHKAAVNVNYNMSIGMIDLQLLPDGT